MTIWEDNFKVNYIDESIINNEKIQKIKLFPIDVKNSKYHTVILKVNLEQKRIKLCVAVKKKFLMMKQ